MMENYVKTRLARYIPIFPKREKERKIVVFFDPNAPRFWPGAVNWSKQETIGRRRNPVARLSAKESRNKSKRG
jgi:hypothetical protein